MADQASEPRRPRRKASLESVSLIKHVASMHRNKRRTLEDSFAESTDSNSLSASSHLHSPNSTAEQNVSGSVYPLDLSLFPSDLGIDFRVGAKVYAKDGFGKWYLAKIVELRPSTGYVLVHFEYWSQKYDEWISASCGRLRAADSEEKPHPGEMVQVGDFVFAKWAEKAGTYPAQIVESLENDKFKLLYYDGFEKIAHRRTLKKMSDAEVRELDLVHFGQLKILPTFPNDLFDPNLADKYDGKRRIRTSIDSPSVASSSNSVRADSPPKSSTKMDDSLETLESGALKSDVIVEKHSMKPLPKKSHTTRTTRKRKAENLCSDVSPEVPLHVVSSTPSVIESSSPSKSTDSADVFLIDVKKSSSTFDADDLPLAQTVQQGGRPSSNVADQTTNELTNYDVIVKGSKMIIKSSTPVSGQLRTNDQLTEPSKIFENRKETANGSVGTTGLGQRSAQVDLSQHTLSERLLRKKRANNLAAEQLFDQIILQGPVERVKKKSNKNLPRARPKHAYSVPSADNLLRGRESWLRCEGEFLFCTPCHMLHQDKLNTKLSRFITGLQRKFWSLERVEWHSQSSMHVRTLLSIHRHPAVVYQGPTIAISKLQHGQHAGPVCRPESMRPFRSIRSRQASIKKEKTPSSPVVVKPLEKKWQQSPVILYRDQWFKKDGERVYCEACRLYCPNDVSGWKSGISNNKYCVLEHENSDSHTECLQKFYKDQKKTALNHIKYLNYLSDMTKKDSIFLCPDRYCCMSFKTDQELKCHVKNAHQHSADKELLRLVRCVCCGTQNETCMIQCDFCSTWQHGYCFDMVDDKHIPTHYICYVCASPTAVRKTVRLTNTALATFDRTGVLPSLLDDADQSLIAERAKRLNDACRAMTTVKLRLREAKLRLKSARTPTYSTVTYKDEENSEAGTAKKVIDGLDTLYDDAEEKMNKMDSLLDDFEMDNRIGQDERDFFKISKSNFDDLLDALRNVREMTNY